MVLNEKVLSRSKAQLLMDIAGTLADYTQNLELCREIPAYLSHVLELERITLAVVRDGTPPQIVLDASSTPPAAAAGEAAAHFAQDILRLHEQTRPLTTQDGPTFRPALEVADLPATSSHALTLQPTSSPSRATVFARNIDSQHRMMLIVHQHASDLPISSDMADLLQLVANQLTKLCGCLMVWLAKPNELGAPFTRLTEREWMVLRGLNSDAGEKQLADQLGLSPHTLHSHIKSIYRKVGVQGRLPLLLRAEEAMRGLRNTRMNNRVISTIANTMPVHAPVAVGQ